MKHIVVPVDFSDAAIHAARFSAFLANKTGWELYLINVYHIPNPLKTLPIELIVTIDELEDATHSQLKAIRSQLIDEFGESLVVNIASKNGNTVDEILEFCRYVNAGLIIAGTKGTGKIKSYVFGNVASSLSIKSPIPILLIPESVEINCPKRMVFLFDGKAEISLPGIHILKTFSTAFNMDLIVEHYESKESSKSKSERTNRIHKQLEDIKPIYKTIMTSNINSPIHALMTDASTGILAMVANPHSGTDRLMGKDHTLNSTYTTSVPLLILK
jgi:nucleotide-binding universal stress UspA family protein